VALLLGLLLGVGLFLVVMGGRPSTSAPRIGRATRSSTHRLLLDAGVVGVTPRQFVIIRSGSALVAFLAVLALSAAAPLALAFGLFGFLAPRVVLRRRAGVRVAARRDAWPEAVDNLVSGVRAGLALPEALGALGTSGPAELRAPFARFAERYQATGSFGSCLDRLADDLADPVGDRVIDALRVAREVGGSDLGLLLRTLARFLREDARTRGEIEARQSWTVNAARVALAAPWLVLLLLATQSTTVQAYNSPSGAIVLAIGGGVSFVAYKLMRRIGQLPADQRVST
jgi:tight adherence protein B